MEFRGNGKPDTGWKILASMLDDPVVLSRISSEWDAGLFSSAEANLIGDWCVQHFRKHGEVPGTAVEQHLQRWSERATPAMVETAQKLLKQVYQQRNHGLSSQFVLDLSQDHFDSIRLKRNAKAILSDYDRGDVEGMRRHSESVTRVQLGSTAEVELGDGKLDHHAEAFNERISIDVVPFRGGLQKFFEGVLVRDALVAVAASDKTGKSFVLLDMAYRAVRNRKRVAYFECGDLSRPDVVARFMTRVLEKPAKPCRLDLPDKIDLEGNVTHRQEEFLLPISPEESLAGYERLIKGQKLFRLTCHANSTISVEGIDEQLRRWQKEEGWVPDCVVIDYADILAAPAGCKERLDQIDVTWQQLRRLSQQWHCLVLTATQTNALAYKNDSGKPILRSHFSGRKTKMAHVNGMFGVAVGHADKAQGRSRWNWVVRRKGFYSETKQATVAGNLALANPTMRSVF